jgi:molybdopterin-guanine dinucleotide biosynthesis protein A
MRMAALILAGGAGSRLGGVDKAFVALDGKPLIGHLLARLRMQRADIAISANGDAARFAAFGLPVLPDGELAGKGPLAGVAAGLAWARDAGAAVLLTVPVDTPFIPADLAERLHPAPAVARHGGRQHHLVASWPAGFLPALLEFLAKPGDYKVRDALALAGARAVDFPGTADPFLNLNTPDDISVALQRMKSPGRP